MFVLPSLFCRPCRCWSVGGLVVVVVGVLSLFCGFGVVSLSVFVRFVGASAAFVLIIAAPRCTRFLQHASAFARRVVVRIVCAYDSACMRTCVNM